MRAFCPSSFACGSPPDEYFVSRGGRPVLPGAPPTKVARGLPPASVFRVQVFSDLHADVAPGVEPVLAANVDAVVVAGDTCRDPVVGFRILRSIVPSPVPLIVVAGNHEHYRAYYGATLDAARRAAPEHGVLFLEDGAVVVGGVRFLGATLWSDYRLAGDHKKASAMAAARDGLNDHRVIGWSKEPYRIFRPQDAAHVHRASRSFLTRALATHFAGPTVVVTHHAPHPRSIHPRYEGDPLNAAFTSDLAQTIMVGKPTLWIHGHVHSSFDYRVGGTRIVCNPRGYGAENPDFDPSLVVEVPR